MKRNNIKSRIGHPFLVKLHMSHSKGHAGFYFRKKTPLFHRGPVEELTRGNLHSRRKRNSDDVSLHLREDVA